MGAALDYSMLPIETRDCLSMVNKRLGFELALRLCEQLLGRRTDFFETIQPEQFRQLGLIIKVTNAPIELPARAEPEGMKDAS